MEHLQTGPGPKSFTRAERAFIQALDHLLETRSFEAVRVTDLLKLSGFTKGAFYGRFCDKYDFAAKITRKAGRIHLDYLLRHTEMKQSGLSLDSPEIVRNATALFAFIYEFRALYNMIIDQKLTGITLDDFILAPMQSQPVPDQSDPHSFFVDYVSIYSSISYVMYWKRQRYRPSIEEITHLALAYEALAFRHYSPLED